MNITPEAHFKGAGLHLPRNSILHLYHTHQPLIAGSDGILVPSGKITFTFHPSSTIKTDQHNLNVATPGCEPAKILKMCQIFLNQTNVRRLFMDVLGAGERGLIMLNGGGACSGRKG